MFLLGRNKSQQLYKAWNYRLILKQKQRQLNAKGFPDDYWSKKSLLSLGKNQLPLEIIAFVQSQVNGEYETEEKIYFKW